MASEGESETPEFSIEGFWNKFNNTCGLVEKDQQPREISFIARTSLHPNVFKDNLMGFLYLRTEGYFFKTAAKAKSFTFQIPMESLTIECQIQGAGLNTLKLSFNVTYSDGLIQEIEHIDEAELKKLVNGAEKSIKDSLLHTPYNRSARTRCMVCGLMITDGPC